MTKKNPKNIALSVRQRLLNLAKEKREDFQLILIRYALERILFRLGQSKHRETFILKGAFLFLVWEEAVHRPTRDVDLLGKGDNSLHKLEEIFREICTQPVPDDGIQLFSETVKAERIKENQEYEGARVTFLAKLGKARIPIQVDVGFGDTVSPKPHDVQFPTLLDFTPPNIRAYPPETVVAEKFQALVQLGMANSRMKDFYDIWVISQRFEFSGNVLSQSIQRTFERRRTPLPSETPLALTHEFTKDPAKQIQWKAFLRKNKLITDHEPELSFVADHIKNFLLPLMQNTEENQQLIWNSASKVWK
ncbi:nucleotidyl transferase AbiEii/AbiGii toxin family protein [bacterium]|nr:nucleotidyl transferase AbiEii/AbiGii toxin family protein [bacterium]